MSFPTDFPDAVAIPDFEGYFATREGLIVSTRRSEGGKILSYTVTKAGYIRIHFGFHKPVFAHRLIAMTFIPNPDDRPQVNHIDGNKANNHVDNLEWVTAQQNVVHAVETGLRMTSQGPSHYKSKFNEEEVLNIRHLYATKKLTHRKIADLYGVDRDTITKIINRKNWAHI